MAIQFRCPGCTQPIEVDDEFAGQNASCPYCQRVVTVPAESNYGMETPPPARPAAGAASEQTGGAGSGSWPAGGGGPSYPPPPVYEGPPAHAYEGPPAPPEHRAAAARKLGNWSLLFSLLVVVGFVAIFGVVITRLFERADLAEPGLAQAEVQARVQAAQAEVMEELSGQAWFLVLGISTFVFSIAGVALAAASLRAGKGANWRAITTLVICLPFLLCQCASVVFGIAGAFAG